MIKRTFLKRLTQVVIMAPKTVKGSINKLLTGDGRKKVSTAIGESVHGKKKKGK